MNNQLAITLSSEKKDFGEVLFLEQEERSPYEGRLTKSGLVQGVLGFIYPDDYVVENACGGEEGVFETTVYAYLYEPLLDYNIALDYGELGERVIEEVEYIEIINCSLKDFVEFSYPSDKVLETKWEGLAYTNMGQVVPHPNYEFDRQGTYFDSSVYASLRVRYRVTRHAYSVRVTSRAKYDLTVTEDKYASVAYAYWDGGIDFEKIEVPYGFEETDGNCGNGSIVRITEDDDPDGPPAVDPENEHIYIDYCKQEEI